MITGILTAKSSGTPLLLDFYPNASAAYSLRKLRSAYSGSAIRVRRDYDNTEQDIGFNSNGSLNTSALQAFVGSENYLYQSQTFNVTGTQGWTKTNVTVTQNAAIAPDGTTTANNCVIANNSSVKSLYQGLPSVSTRDYVFSIYAKANQYNYAQLLAIRDNTNRYSVIVDLTTGLITQSNSVGTPNFVNSSVTPVGNGWYRIVITLNINNGINYFVFSPSPVANPTLNGTLDMTSAGDGTSGVYFWGAQLNYYSLKTYQVTTTSQAIYCSGYVTTWYDQSGNGRDQANTTLANQPTIVLSGVLYTQNSLPTIYFDGTNDRLTYRSATSFITSSTLSSWAVTNKINNTNNSGRVYSIERDGVYDYNSIETAVLTAINSSNVAETYRNGAQRASQSYTYNTFVLFNTIYTGSTAYLYKNNSSSSSSSISGNFNSQSLNIGCGVGNAGDFHIGYISEVILYTTDQSSNRTGINNNINSYFTLY